MTVPLVHFEFFLRIFHALNAYVELVMAQLLVGAQSHDLRPRLLLLCTVSDAKELKIAKIPWKVNTRKNPEIFEYS